MQHSSLDNPNFTNTSEITLYLGMHMDEALVRFGASLFSTRVMLQMWV